MNNFNLFARSLGLGDLPGLVEAGNHPAQVGELFQAAAQYRRSAPWKRLGLDQPLAVRLEDPPLECIVVLGADDAGGLIAFDDRQQMLEFFNPNPSQPSISGRLQAVFFVKSSALPATDREAARKYIPHAKDYPLPLVFSGDTLQRPRPEELLFFIAALHATGAFVSGQLEPDEAGDYLPVEAEYEIQAMRRVLHLTLHYPVFETGGAGSADLELSAVQREAAVLARHAWEDSDPERRIALARRALSISPDAADAYTVLAEEADYPEEALAWLQKAVDASDTPQMRAALEALGDDRWSAAGARPFLRARLALAETLEHLGRAEAALAQYLVLLTLDPADHSGARYAALALLVRLKRSIEAEALIRRYRHEQRADWDYTRALLAFGAGGDTPAARRLLDRALRRNAVVPEYLSGALPLPLDEWETAELGAEEEAHAYALRNYAAWWATPGAMAWLVERSKTPNSGMV